jgi:hypothetical protein
LIKKAINRVCGKDELTLLGVVVNYRTIRKIKCSNINRLAPFRTSSVVSKPKESLKRIHTNALSLLDLTYTRDDLALLLEDARKGLERKSIGQIQESLDLFVDLLDFEPLLFDVLERDLQVFARPGHENGPVRAFEHLIIFDEETLSLGLKRGAFSPENDLDLAWVIKYARSEEPADLKGIDVFKFLAELALEKAQAH